VFSQTPGGANVEKKDINFKTIVRAAEGFIRGSLNEAIKSFFNNEWVVSRFEDAYIWDHDLNKKISREDKFKIILEEKYDHGLLVKYGEVLRAELTLQGQTIQRVSLSSQGERVFIDPDKSFRDRLFFAPVDFLHISSPFSKRRFHPVRRNIQPHLGMDFALPEGSPVYAPRDGTITDAAKKRGSGNFIVIDHQDGYSSIYNHLKGFAQGVQIGQKVKAGEVIAFVGCTGYCTSPHLHFSIRKGKTMLNPAPLTKPYPFRLKDYERSEEYRNILVGLDQRT
jgi:murein DD-endopeptidase MepM/ murein hydrolase activator NlpD